MSYSGNSSLSPDVQQRATATFEQTLELAARGRDQEALAGCEFILGLDPQYEPARKLQQRLRNPERPVRVDDLSAPPPSAPAPSPADTAPFAARQPSAAPAAAPETRPPTSGLAAVLHHLLTKKSYRQVMQIATTQAQAIERDPQLQALVAEARAALGGDSTEPVPSPPAAEDLPSFHTEPAVSPAPADQGVEAPADDDLLDLQRLSLSLDAEHDDPLSQVDSEAHLEELTFGDEPASDDMSGDDVAFDDTEAFGDEEAAGDDFDLGGGLEELDSLALDEDMLPELDDVAPSAAAPPPVEEPVAAPAAPPVDADIDVGSVIAAPGDEDEEENQERIVELLDEGQGIFDRGDYQGAIDVWSRIFLIDISNGEASSRIEEARRKKAELERQVEEIFHEGVGHIQSESLEEAKDAFRRVLEIDSHHSLAKDYLEQLEAGKVPTVVSRQSEAADLEDFAADVAGATVADASPSLEAAVERDRIVVVKKTDKRLIALAAVVAILVVGAAAYLFLNKDKLFPNTAQAPAPVAPQIDPIVRATRLHESGQTEKAIEQLRAIPADDPAHAKAVALIDQWQALIAAREEVDVGPPPEVLARRNLMLVAARQAHKEKRFIKARKYFEQAHKILPLEAEDRALKLNCDAELQDLSEEIQKFEAREYALILPDLWRRREVEPENPDVDQLIVDAYYNLSLVDLQRGDPAGAAAKLKDALEVEPENRDLKRLQLFAETYAGRSQDLLYSIFVKYLPSRDL